MRPVLSTITNQFDSSHGVRHIESKEAFGRCIQYIKGLIPARVVEEEGDGVQTPHSEEGGDQFSILPGATYRRDDHRDEEERGRAEERLAAGTTRLLRAQAQQNHQHHRAERPAILALGHLLQLQ